MKPRPRCANKSTPCAGPTRPRDDFTNTGANFDSLISLFDDADGHLISGDDSSSGGVHFHLTRDLEAGTYTVLITSARATRYLLTENARLRTRDGVNSGGGCYLNGDATLDGMKTFLNADDDFSGVAYSLNITTPMPEPASYALVALALTGLAL